MTESLTSVGLMIQPAHSASLPNGNTDFCSLGPLVLSGSIQMRCLKSFDWVACVMAALACLVRAISVPGFLKSVTFDRTAQFGLEHEFTEQFLDFVDVHLQQNLAGNCGG